MIKLIIIVIVSFILAIAHVWIDTKIKKRRKGGSDDD